MVEPPPERPAVKMDQTIERKAKEFFLALEINKKYSKQEILTMYLNNSYFGNGVWGVEDASKIAKIKRL